MLFYVFIDGIGFGKKDPDTNPFTRFSQSVFRPLGGHPEEKEGVIYKETDAAMGVPGLPQSATGQTSLWTGLNGPMAVGRHINGFPTFTLKKMIARHSIVKTLNENGKKADLINSYTPIYLEKIKKNPRLQSASTLVQKASGRPLKDLDDLRSYRGIYMDITHQILRQIARDFLSSEDPLLEIRDPYWVGSQVPQWFSGYDLAVFEYFITDKAGHDQNWEYAERAIHDLEKFLEGFLDSMDPDQDSLIVTSDHGNMEDLSTERHTLNPVPTLLAGAITKSNPSGIRSLKDIPPFIYRFLGLEALVEGLEQADREFRKDIAKEKPGSGADSESGFQKEKEDVSHEPYSEKEPESRPFVN